MFTAFTSKRHLGEIQEYQRVIDDLTMQLELALLENERLTGELIAHEMGRDEQDLNYQSMLLDHQQQIQKLIDEKKAHDKTCLHDLSIDTKRP